MSKLKLQIKSVAGSILFEYEKENNSIKETVTAFLQKMKGAWIDEADLSNMDLSGVDFRGSTFYNSTFDNSTFYFLVLNRAQALTLNAGLWE